VVKKKTNRCEGGSFLKKDGPDLIGGFEKISEQVLNGIVQSIEAAVILHDRSLKVVFINGFFERIFEIKEKDALGRSPIEFLPEFDGRNKLAILSRLRNTLKTGVKSNYHEFPYCSPSGRYRHLLAVSIPIFDSDRKITHVMSVIYDLTHRKELEKEAVKEAKLSSVADMAYTLAHEINNPLTGIKLGLSTLYGSLKRKENIQVLDSVMKDLNRIQHTVHAFLKAKKKPPRMSRESINIIRDILDDVLFHLSGQLDLKNIQVRKKISNLDSCIMIDRDGVHQVLLNVLLNAIQAVQDGDKITVSTNSTKSVNGYPNHAAFLRIAVTDTGIGLDAKKSNQVFTPFYSSKSGGTGLGLSICKNIIAAHEGFMEFESDEGKGTTVNIFLPVVNTEDPDDEPG
jgi:two-component system nitrogen regulation sensor histidine kinase GlnL